jgi:hypothetical protein
MEDKIGSKQGILGKALDRHCSIRVSAFSRIRHVDSASVIANGHPGCACQIDANCQMPFGNRTRMGKSKIRVNAELCVVNLAHQGNQ